MPTHTGDTGTPNKPKCILKPQPIKHHKHTQPHKSATTLITSLQIRTERPKITFKDAPQHTTNNTIHISSANTTTSHIPFKTLQPTPPEAFRVVRRRVRLIPTHRASQHKEAKIKNANSVPTFAHGTIHNPQTQTNTEIIINPTLQPPIYTHTHTSTSPTPLYTSNSPPRQKNPQSESPSPIFPPRLPRQNLLSTCTI